MLHVTAMPSNPPDIHPPDIRIAVTPDSPASTEDDTGGSFLAVRHFQLVAHYPSGETSAPFAYDVVHRRALDAVIVLAHHTQNGQVHVYLRSAVRPPLVLRDDPEPTPGQWELMAGLIEPGESPRAAGVRELEEELGFHVSESQLQDLGPYTYPVPGFIGERQVFFHVEVDPKTRRIPSEDGSALERGASIVDLPLGEALALARDGKLRDAKTELALRRLVDTIMQPQYRK